MSSLSGVVLDVETCPDEVASWLATADVGVGLLTPVGRIDVERLSLDGTLDAMTGVARVLGHYSALLQRLMARVDSFPAPKQRDEEHKQYVREEVACVLRVPSAEAGDLLATGSALVSRFPTTLDALDQGRISDRHCRTLVEQTWALSDAAATKVEQKVLPRAEQQTPQQFRASVRRAVLAADPAGAGARREVAQRERDVRLVPQFDDMAGLWITTGADDAAAIMSRVQHEADRLKTLNDGRTAGQLRADAFVNLMLGPDSAAAVAPGSGSAPDSGSRLRPLVQVTVAMSTLLGIDDQPGELAGYGPISPTLARRIAFDPTGTWRRLITDGRGVLIDHGRTRYEPPTALADFVKAKHQVCRMVGCTRSAYRCELDHRVAWADGGHTNEQNLEPLCRRHHHLKHEAGWTLERDGDDFRWSSPTGRTYTDSIATYPIDTTAAESCVPRESCVPGDEPVDEDPDPPPF